MSATRKYPSGEGRLCSAGRMQQTLLMTDDKERFEVHRLEVVNTGFIKQNLSAETRGSSGQAQG